MQENYPELAALVQKLNDYYALEIDLEYIAEIYGESIVASIAEQPEELEKKVMWLLEKGFEETTSDICNRYGILLCQWQEDFVAGFEKLIGKLGADYAEQIAEDLSLLEELM